MEVITHLVEDVLSLHTIDTNTNQFQQKLEKSLIHNTERGAEGEGTGVGGGEGAAGEGSGPVGVEEERRGAITTAPPRV
jgi:hypothetical protein